MKKKILVCAGHFYPYVGGYEKYIQELYKRMTNEFDVDILTYDNQKNPQYEKIDGLNVYRLSSFDFRNVYPVMKPTLKNFKLLFKLFKKRYDFVNTQTRFFSINLIGLFFSKLKKVKLIHTEHGTSHVILDNKFVSKLSEIYDHFFGGWIIKSAWKNIGVSNASCKFSKHLGAKNTYLVPNGVDTSIFRKKKTDLKKKTEINKEYKIITFIGRLIYAKGVQDLIAIFPKIKEKYPTTKLLIVGDGNYKKKLEKLAKKDKDIMFLGQREDVVDILNITDVFVNPSYSEGMPTSVLEAAAVGVKIVATDVGGTNEILSNPIKPHDKKQLVERILFLIKFNNCGNKYRRIYDLKDTSEKYLNITKL